MRTFLDLGEETIEVTLDTPHWQFSEEETARRDRWRVGALLTFWFGLVSILVAVLVFSFFWTVGGSG